MSGIRERPIILTAQEVNAVLAGDKKQHRIPALINEQVINGYRFCYGVASGQVIFTKDESDESFIDDGYISVECPLGKVGDRLWVQEPSLIHCDWDWFYTDNTLVECKESFTPNDFHLPWDDKHQEYKGAVGAEYLPRWASRILLEITDIRIERVQDTSHADAVAEGVHSFDIEARLRDQPLSVAQIVFSRHWDTKHQEHCVMWEDNPWVWVIEFKVIKESDCER